MPNSKRRCRYCKEYTKEWIKTPGGVFCSFDHATQFAMEKAKKDKSKAYDKKTRELKAKHRQSDLKIRKNAAKKACHDYIRARDKGNPCICCGRPWKDTFQAGHFIESGNYPAIRFHEDNIHSQSVHCNMHKGGDSGEYEERLREKIGDERVDWLKDNRHTPIKRTAEDYLEIEQYYKARLKELQP